MTSLLKSLASSASQSGLVGEASSGAQATIYLQPRRASEQAIGGNLLPSADIITCDGVSERDDNPCIIGMQMQASIGQGQSCNLLIKSRLDLLSLVKDDDWIDLTLSRGATRWHIFRGSIDEVRETSVATPTGSTTTAYQITARGFQKVWEMTPIWFENTLGENIGNQDVLEVFGKQTDRSVAGMCFSFLYRFFAHLVALGRNGLNVPPAMLRGLPSLPYQPLGSGASTRPLISINAGEGLIEYDESQYSRSINPRLANTQNNFYPDGTLWQAAAQWSDPVFCEMFTDLLPQGGLAAMAGKTNPLADGLPIAGSQMTCVLRDRPFVIGGNPITFAGLYQQLPVLSQSAWFSLPKYEIPEQYVLQSSLGRSGYDRYNAFYTSLTDLPGAVNGNGNRPNWDTADNNAHGLRRFDGQTRYAPSIAVPSNQYFASRRQQIRDWYAINGELRQGTFALGCGLPGVRYGTRLHVKRDNKRPDFHGYIENYAHIYQPGAGIKTQIGVTRGYVGDAYDIVQLVNQVTLPYAEATRGEPPSES